jgi:hypothetical protein
MNAPSSKMASKIYTNRRYGKVLPHETNNEDSEHTQHNQQQSFNNPGTTAASPQWQHNRPLQYYSNQNERQPSRPAQYLAKTSVELSPVSPSQTQPLLASNVQGNYQNKQYRYERQYPGINSLS